MKAIILAGGKATRLPHSAKTIPKVLVDIGGKPVLQHQIDLLEKYGISDIRLSLGNRSDQIIKYLAGKYEYIVEPEPLDTGGAIAFAVRGLKDPFLVLNGDVLSNIDISQFVKEFHESKAEHMVAVWHTDDARSFGLVNHEGGIVSEFLEKPKERVAGFINAGMYILSPAGVYPEHGERRFSIEREVFPNLINRQNLAVFVHDGWWEEMGTEERLLEIQKNFANTGKE